MSRLEDEEKIHPNTVAAGPVPPPPAPDFIDQILASSPFPTKSSDKPFCNGTGPALPPAMEGLRGHTVDDVYKMINRTPLFMTTLDETDGEGGENVELEAIKALMHEGTTAEIAGNFREQGNEQAKAKRWKDAKAFYDQALAALKNPKRKFEAEQGVADLDVVEVDEAAEEKKERQIEEACYVNRALCNLELSTCYIRTAVHGLMLMILPRKLSFLHAGLCCSPPSQPTKRQSLLPLVLRMPGR